MPNAHPKPTVLIVRERCSAQTLLSAIRKTTGSLVLVVMPDGFSHLSDEHIQGLLRDAHALHPDRNLILACKDQRARSACEVHGWVSVHTLKQLRPLIRGCQSEQEAIRVFSPASWRQNIRTRLQTVGLLTLPKMRIWFLFIFSLLSFLFVFFRLLPSADIRIWPNQETNTFTMNIYLMSSGSKLPIPADRVHVLPLTLLTVHISRAMTYDQVSKKFTGTNATMRVTIYNDADESYALRNGTRLLNQAGMRFRMESDVMLPPHSSDTVSAVADPVDQYGEVLGERGNVPAGVKWYFPGLSEKERTLVYARNQQPATGGQTSYVNILTKEDIEGSPRYPGARQRLEQELIMVARQQVEEDRNSRNALQGTSLVELQYEDLTKKVFKNFNLSESFVGRNVLSIPIQGELDYSVILYDEHAMLSLLSDEIEKRVPDGKMIVKSTLVPENVDIHVIAPWDDDLRWVKITADLTYNLRYVINPLTPAGAKFGKYIRENVAGKSVAEAYRIIKNLPEVARVNVTLWPPWAFSLPTIQSNIAIAEEVEN